MEDIGIYHLKAFIMLELCLASTNDRENSKRSNLNTVLFTDQVSYPESALLLTESRLKKKNDARLRDQ